MKKIKLKFTTILLLIFSLAFVPLNGRSGESSDIGKQDILLTEALDQLSEEYQVFFAYDADLLRDMVVDSDLSKYKSLDEAVSGVLNESGLKFELVGAKYCVIYKNTRKGSRTKKKLERKIRQIDALQKKGGISLQRSTNTGKYKLPIKAITRAYAELTAEMTISGKITDEEGEPLIGAAVAAKGTTSGTVSDVDGNYRISVPDDVTTLEFSYIGYTTQEVEINGRSVINVTLQLSSAQLEEIVVIGYGTQRKVNLTSAVQMVDTDDLENRPVKSVAEMLSASVPGLNITTTSGAPNAESGLNIRGFTGFNATGAPLILVDGVPQDIEFVNANDVESISVLKDAAASAIYGSRAPNGVVLITTKSGKKGQKMQINFSTDMMVSSPIGIPETVNSDVNAIFRNNQRYNHLRSPLWSDEAIERMGQYIAGEITTTNIILPSGKYGSVYEYNANNTHYETAFRDNVFNQRYNVNVLGGSERTSYYASIGLIDNQGVYDSPVDWMKRYSALIKVNTDITDWLSVGVSSKYGRQQSSRPRIWRNGQNDGNLFDAAGFFPSLPDYDDNGSPNEFSVVPNLSGIAGSFDNTNDDLWLTGQFDFKPVKGLSIQGDYTWNTNHGFDNNTSFVFNSWDADGTPKPSRRSPPRNEIEERTSNTNYHNLNLVTTYKLQLSNHDLTLLAGYNEEENNFKSLYGYNSLFYSTSVPSLSTTYGDSPVVDDVIYSWATQGYFGRVSYNYKGTYLLDFNARYDASSKYSPDTRWAFFPSVSAGYNIARENFWPLKGYVDMFKIKGSWGRLGNNTGSNYAYLPTLGTNSQTPVILDGGRLPYVSMPGIIADDLTWTKPRTIGFGLEAGALKNRLIFEYDWYQRTVFDQQGPAEQYSEVLGTSAPRRNNAVSETRGWELLVSWRDKAFNMRGSAVNYSVRAGISDYIGYVVEYEENETGVRSSWTPGQVFGELYGYTWGGIGQSPEDFQNATLWRNGWFYPGDFNFADTNGDGLVNHGQGGYWYAQGDRKFLGYNYPRYKYHIALSASWKGFTASALFDGVGKQTLYTRRKFVMVSKNYYTVQQAELGGTWNLNNQDAFFPRSYDFNYNQIWERNANDKYLHNMAHLRIRNVNLSYEVPANLVSQIGLRRLSVIVSAENLGMVYYKSWANHFDPIQFQQDFGTYPPSRTFSLGVKLGI